MQCDFGGDDDSDGGALTAADAGAPAGAPESAWKQYLRGYADWPEEQRYQAIEALLGQLAQAVQSPQVFRRPNDRKVELRGVFQGYPVRLEIENDGTVVAAMNAQQREHVVASFTYEPTFVPEPQVRPWAHGDTARVFIGKGVFVEGHAGTTYIAAGIESPGNIDRMTALVARLGPAMVREIAATMTSENIHWLHVGPELTDASIRSELQQMYDPLQSLWRVLGLFASLAQAFPALTANDPAQVPEAALGALSLRCRYCHALYVIGEAGRCPNCGGPSH